MLNVVVFSHPKFLGSQSMPRYTNFLYDNLVKKNLIVKLWSPKSFFHFLHKYNKKVGKYLSYIDQYVIFPFEVKMKLIFQNKETLYVFADQALGPWVNLVKNKKHVIHCHDFIALKSSFNLIPENNISWSGKLYQKYIQNGFSNGKYFISISNNTKKELELFHKGSINLSEVCYNGLNKILIPIDSLFSRTVISKLINVNLNNGYILHVGGNQFYKNRIGCIKIYNAWRKQSKYEYPLLLVGEHPSIDLLSEFNKSNFKEDIYFLTSLQDEYINYCYSGATCLLFPSLEEGFGWPIAEAMASGCLVITTNQAPMTEVAGQSNCFLIDRMPFNNKMHDIWASRSARAIDNITDLNYNDLQICINSGLENSKRFNPTITFNEIFSIYNKIVEI
jgi:glycosyltransferase involved in cell wall biosynthesis